MQINAILCDAASVRENLLFLMGGGITRVWRPTFPALFAGSIALLVSVEPAETADHHRLRVSVSGEDGAQLTELKAEFQMAASGDRRPGEPLLIPMALDLRLQIPKPGAYSIDIVIDEQLQRSLGFHARVRQAPQTPPA